MSTGSRGCRPARQPGSYLPPRAKPYEAHDNKKRGPSEEGPLKDQKGANESYLGGLGAFRPARDLKLHLLSFVKGPKTFSLDSRVVDKDIIPFISLEEEGF